MPILTGCVARSSWAWKCDLIFFRASRLADRSQQTTVARAGFPRWFWSGSAPAESGAESWPRLASRLWVMALSLSCKWSRVSVLNQTCHRYPPTHIIPLLAWQYNARYDDYNRGRQSEQSTKWGNLVRGDVESGLTRLLKPVDENRIDFMREYQNNNKSILKLP